MIHVTNVNEIAGAVDFVFGNVTFTVLVRGGEKGLEASIPSDDAAHDLPNWVLVKSKIQARTIIRDRRKRSLEKRDRVPGVPEQLSFPRDMNGA